MTQTRCCSLPTHRGHLAPSTPYRHRQGRGQPARSEVPRPSSLRGPSWQPCPGPRWPSWWPGWGTPTPEAAMRYEHAAAGRDQVIAEALSKIAPGGV